MRWQRLSHDSRRAAGGTAKTSCAEAVAQKPAGSAEVSAVNMRDAAEIEHAVAAFARVANRGLIVTACGSAVHHGNLIVTLAVRHKLPAVYSERNFVAAGGLISYGPNLV